MKGRKSGAVSIFLGLLLILIFAVGLIRVRNPAAFFNPNQYDVALDHFVAFCSAIWLPAGIIGIPLFLVSLILSLVREKKEK